jgi:hypothetical protein
MFLSLLKSAITTADAPGRYVSQFNRPTSPEASLGSLGQALTQLAESARRAPDFAAHDDPDEWAALLQVHADALANYSANPHDPDLAIFAQQALHWIADNLTDIVPEDGE